MAEPVEVENTTDVLAGLPEAAPTIPPSSSSQVPPVIDYSPLTGPEKQLLSIPERSGRELVLYWKMTALAEVVSSDKSLAVATKYRNMAYSSQDAQAIAKAKNGMHSDQLKQYEDWVEGNLVLPDLESDIMNEPSRAGKRRRNRNKARLEAIKIIWRYPAATFEDFAYIGKHLSQ